jgi:hypothetical protein
MWPDPDKDHVFLVVFYRWLVSWVNVDPDLHEDGGCQLIRATLTLDALNSVGRKFLPSNDLNWYQFLIGINPTENERPGYMWSSFRPLVPFS